MKPSNRFLIWLWHAQPVLLSLLFSGCFLFRQPTPARVEYSAMTINGHAARLIIDTGAFGLMLPSSGADRLGLKYQPLSGSYVNSLDGTVEITGPTQVGMGGGELPD